MPRKKQKAKRQSQTERQSYKLNVKWILEVVLFATLLTGGAILAWNSFSDTHQTGNFFTLGNLGFLMLGVGWLRLQMLLFPKWTEKQCEKESPSKTRIRFMRDSHDD